MIAGFELVDVVVGQDRGPGVRIHGCAAAAARRCWGERGVVGGNPTSPLEVWRTLVEPGLVTGGVVRGAGHFLAEENHADTLAALQAFLGKGASCAGVDVPRSSSSADTDEQVRAPVGSTLQDVCMAAQSATALRPPPVGAGAA